MAALDSDARASRLRQREVVERQPDRARWCDRRVHSARPESAEWRVQLEAGRGGVRGRRRSASPPSATLALPFSTRSTARRTSSRRPRSSATASSPRRRRGAVPRACLVTSASPSARCSASPRPSSRSSAWAAPLVVITATRCVANARRPGAHVRDLRYARPIAPAVRARVVAAAPMMHVGGRRDAHVGGSFRQGGSLTTVDRAGACGRSCLRRLEGRASGCAGCHTEALVVDARAPLGRRRQRDPARASIVSEWR